jgi:hypothetical protein
VLVRVMSFFEDFTYEGSRSIIGPFGHCSASRSPSSSPAAAVAFPAGCPSAHLSTGAAAGWGAAPNMRSYRSGP